MTTPSVVAFDRSAARWAAALGLITLVTAGLLSTFSGPVPPPAPGAPVPGNAMLSFELAHSAGEVIASLGPLDGTDPSAAERRARLDHANWIDFSFMLAYSLYNAALILFAAAYWRRRSMPRLAVGGLGIVLGIAMYVGDFMENEQLLALTPAKVAGDIDDAVVSALMFWTRVKWLAIAGASFVIALGYGGGPCRAGWKVTWIVPLLFAAAGVCTALSVTIVSMRPLLAIAATLLAASWFAAFLHSTVHALRPIR